MSEGNKKQMSEAAGNWLGWLGIIVGVIGFFWQHIWMGGITIVLGIIGCFSPKKSLNTVAIVIGAIALIIGLAK